MGKLTLQQFQELFIEDFQLESHWIANFRLHLLETSQVDECLKFLTKEQMTRLSKDQIRNLDTGKLNKEQFDGLFNMPHDRSKSSFNLMHLNLQQIKAAWSHFDAYTKSEIHPNYQQKLKDGKGTFSKFLQVKRDLKHAFYSSSRIIRPASFCHRNVYHFTSSI